jgi:tetratricopeptide (TPR) repeat protein
VILPFRIPSIAYLYFVYLLLFLFPISMSIDASNQSRLIMWLTVEGLSIAIFALTHHYTRSKELTLHSGLVEICESRDSGCVNITFLYLIPMLLLAYLLAVMATLIGLFKGRQYSQERWIAVVTRLGRGVQYGPIVYDITRALTRAPNSADLYMRRAKEYEKCGEKILALADYEKALSLQYRNPDILFCKGRLCEELGRRRDAILAYRTFLSYASAVDGERKSLVRDWLKLLDEET